MSTILSPHYLTPKLEHTRINYVCVFSCVHIYSALRFFYKHTIAIIIIEVESLIFLYFELLGGTYAVCGLTVAVTVMFEIPIFHLSATMLSKVGTAMMQQIACAAYVVRVIGYTIIPSDGHHIIYVLLMEPLHGVTYACSTSSSVEFIANFMPEPATRRVARAYSAPFEGAALF